MERVMVWLRRVGLLVLLAGLALAWPGPGQAAEKKNFGFAVSLVAGETFAFGLPANPTTGYLWQMAEEPDQEVIELLEHELEERDCCQGCTGCGGVDVWRFRALEPGMTTLRLNYIRPWRPEVVARQAEVLVVVYGE